MRRVLIVEDEGIIATELQMLVENIEMQVVHRARTADEAYAFLSENDIDIVLLDINLSGEYEGIEIAKYIQNNKPQISIIFVTSYTDEDILRAVSEVSFSAYIVKPFRRAEVEVTLNMERIKLDNASSTPQLLFDQYKFDAKKSLLLYGELFVPLSKKEQMLIQLLVTFHGNVVPFATIDNEVWPDKSVSENARRNLVHKINQKLPIPLISTKHGVGYFIQSTS